MTYIWQIQELYTTPLKFCWRQTSSINWQLNKWFLSYIYENFATILLMPAKLKHFIQHETVGFWKTRHDVMKFWYQVIDKEMTRHFSCVVDISLWLKFGGHTINRTTFYFIYFIRILSGSFSPCVFYFKEMLSTYMYIHSMKHGLELFN